MPDIQEWTDICGQMRGAGAGAAAGRSPHELRRPSSKVISRRSLNVTQRPVAQQQPAPAIHVLHKEGWAEPNSQFPLFYEGA